MSLRVERDDRCVRGEDASVQVRRDRVIETAVGAVELARAVPDEVPNEADARCHSFLSLKATWPLPLSDSSWSQRTPALTVSVGMMRHWFWMNAPVLFDGVSNGAVTSGVKSVALAV